MRGAFFCLCLAGHGRDVQKPFIAAFQYEHADPAKVASFELEMEEQVDRLVKKVWGQQARLSSVQAYKLTIVSRQIPTAIHLEAPFDSSRRHPRLR